MLLAGMIFIESYGDPLAKSPTGPAGIAQLTKGSARELGLVDRKESTDRVVARQENAMDGKGKRREWCRQTGADLQNDR